MKDYNHLINQLKPGEYEPGSGIYEDLNSIDDEKEWEKFITELAQKKNMEIRYDNDNDVFVVSGGRGYKDGGILKKMNEKVSFKDLFKK